MNDREEESAPPTSPLAPLSYLLLFIQTGLRSIAYRGYMYTFLALLDPKTEDVILDVGAGTGYIASKVAERCDELFALEPNDARVEYIRRRFREVKAFSATAEHVPFPDSYFTKAYAVASFHHFEDQDEALEEMARILRRGGTLLIHEGNPNNKTKERSLELAVMKNKIHFVTSGELSEMAKEHGFSTQSVTNLKKGYFLLAVKS